MIEERLGLPASPAEPTHPLNAFPAGLPATLVAQALGLRRRGVHARRRLRLVALRPQACGRRTALGPGRRRCSPGGVSRPDPLYTQMGFSQLRGALGPRQALAVRRAADGLIVGEGAGLFVLKRLDDAVRQGDTIHGVIRGIGLSNDVHGDLLAPSSEGQLRAMRAAYDQAGWSPQDVDLIECHATGTPVGDAVEFESLKRLWGDRESGWRPGQCVIGSVKSNVGHTLTAAGAAGLLKVLLALKHRVLPPTANFTQAAPALGLRGKPFPRAFRARSLASPRARPTPTRRDQRVRLRRNQRPSADRRMDGNRFPRSRSPRAGSPPFGFATPGQRIRRTHCDRGDGGSFRPVRGLAGLSAAGAGREPIATRQPSRGRWWGVPQTAWHRDRHPDAQAFRGYYLDSFRLRVDRFRIPPRELEEMLPQQSLMLKVAAEAIADAGWDRALGLRTAC